MNYLKKYRQEAGLANNDENRVSSTSNNPYCDNTPTKDTLAYLKQQSHAVGGMMKTPVRNTNSNISGGKMTPSAMKDGRNSVRLSAVKPFGRVDTNMVAQNSSRRSG